MRLSSQVQNAMWGTHSLLAYVKHLKGQNEEAVESLEEAEGSPRRTGQPTRREKAGYLGQLLLAVLPSVQTGRSTDLPGQSGEHVQEVCQFLLL